MRVHGYLNQLIILACVLACSEIATAQTCSTADDYECPSGTSSMHNLRAFFFGFLDMSGANTIKLGAASNGALRACVRESNGSWISYGVYDDQEAGTPIGLAEDSQFCLGAGADTLEVMTSNFNCGGISLYPLDFNGYTLRIIGNDGADYVHVYSSDTSVCGGPGNDYIVSHWDSTTPAGLLIDGWTGDDTIYTANMSASGPIYFYGYSENDTITVDGNSFFTIDARVYGEGGNDCIMVYDISNLTLSCGVGTDATNVSPRPGDCESAMCS